MQVKGVASVTRREMRAHTCRDTNRELVLAVHTCFMNPPVTRTAVFILYLRSGWQRFSSSRVNARLQISKKALKLRVVIRISRILQKKNRYHSRFHRTFPHDKSPYLIGRSDKRLFPIFFLASWF
jgi:hypothetical protein